MSSPTRAGLAPGRGVGLAWAAALAVAALAVLAPWQAEPGARLLAGVGGYPALAVQNTYRMIRMAMPWLPAGMLLALVLPARTVRMATLIAVIAGAGVALFAIGGAAGVALARDMLFVLPGAAAGIWLAERTRGGAPWPMPAAGTDNAALAPPPDAAAPLSPAGADMPDQRDAAAEGRPRAWAWRLAGAALVAAGRYLAADLPRFGPAIAAGLAVYAALLWRRPLACLVVVPAALPLFDLAPWTGRFVLDEFDLLVLVSAGGLMLRGVSLPSAPLARGGAALAALFLASAGVSVVLGLMPLPPLDANAFSSYWSAFNALRVGKGVLLGVALFMMLRLARDEATLARLLLWGMAAGLLGVGAAGVWERWLFAGLADESSLYRIVSTFSSMHTGGGHIEAYLVCAVPFLWLGLTRARSAVPVAAVLTLSAYVMIYTVARGGVLAFVASAAILAVATLRTAPGTGLRRAAASALALFGATALVVAGAGAGYFMQRFERSAEDWGIRVAHWQLALDIADDGLAAQLFGTGAGSFPRRYLERGPAERQAATYGFAADSGDIHLRMGVGETLYVAQRVAVRAGGTYRLTLEARARGQGAALATPLCEKMLLNSRRCDWNEFTVPGDGGWHTLTREFRPAAVGQGLPWQHLPVELYFHNAGKVAAIDIDRVSLVDAQGNDLVGNGNFSRGMDFWFFKTQSHLPWHIKNVWVHAVFEFGWVGALLFVMLVAAAVTRLGAAGWRGSRLAWALLASLAGLLTVGMFDSLLDAPRLAALLTAWLLLGACRVWTAAAQVRRPRAG